MNLGTRSGVCRGWVEALAKKRAWRRGGNVRTNRERRRFSMPDVNQAKLRGEEVTGWTYGNVLTRVYRNRSKTGKTYYTVVQVRVYRKGKGEAVGTSKSFYHSNLEDMHRGLDRAAGWLDEKKREESVLM